LKTQNLSLQLVAGQDERNIKVIQRIMQFMTSIIERYTVLS